jgi:hypothetical protein
MGGTSDAPFKLAASGARYSQMGTLGTNTHNEIRRYWRLYELYATRSFAALAMVPQASNGPDLLTRHVSSIWCS